MKCRLGGQSRADGFERAGRAMITSWFRIVSVAASLAGALFAATSPAHAEKRVALVMGNDAYKNVPSLKKAVNDAHAMGDALRGLGFQVLTAENQTRVGFADTLLAFDNMIEPGDVAFFFFAGHGFE